ncbi:MAG: acetyl-CoA carboxylase carboxyltransferase subunit alpha [Acidobacteriota bacterium]|nr:acetyl-CoA carboxylase carboxyltransferase subunit alpha [Acidobacteriota bacterium]
MSRDPNNFEEPILELKARIEGLKAQPATPKLEREIDKLEQKLRKLQADTYASLTDWQRCLVARHPKRPYTRDYISNLFEEFDELHGDRRFADDPAIMAGFGTFRGRTLAVIGHQKGRDIKQKLHRNFGMPRPEGYRKALRVMKTAEKFGAPIVTFIDTPGAYPGIDAEERGQGEAIAFNLKEMAMLKVPVLVYVIGEGGSGGALALGVGDHICILANSIYSVISPEGCASILWKDADQMATAAEALHLTAPKLQKLGLVDSICEEPPGGAHDNPNQMFSLLGEHLAAQLAREESLSVEERIEARYQKFRVMGSFMQAG